METPKKRGRKPKSTSDASPIVQSAKSQKKRVSLSANLSNRQKEGRKPREGKLPTPGHAIWKSVSLSQVDTSTESTLAESKMRPRQWCSSKEELLAILPELTAPNLMINCPAPLILIEETDGMSLSDSNVSNENRTVVDLCVQRDFTCMISDLTDPNESSVSFNTTCPGAVPLPPPTFTEKSEATEVLSTSTSEPEIDSTVTAVAPQYEPQRSPALLSIVRTEEPPSDLVSVMNRQWGHGEDEKSGCTAPEKVAVTDLHALTLANIPTSEARDEVPEISGRQLLPTAAGAHNVFKRVAIPLASIKPVTSVFMEASSDSAPRVSDQLVLGGKGSHDIRQSYRMNLPPSPQAIQAQPLPLANHDLERRPFTRSQVMEGQRSLQKNPVQPMLRPASPTRRSYNSTPRAGTSLSSFARPALKVETSRKRARDLDLAGPVSPLTPEDVLPVLGWENMYGSTSANVPRPVLPQKTDGSVLKTLKFKKKKIEDTLVDEIGGSPARALDIADGGWKSLHDPSCLHEKCLETGEIVESRTSPSQAVDRRQIQPPMNTRWSMLQAMVVQELFRRAITSNATVALPPPGSKSPSSTMYCSSPFIPSSPLSDYTAITHNSPKLISVNVTDEPSPATKFLRDTDLEPPAMIDSSLSPTPSLPRRGRKRRVVHVEGSLAPPDTKRIRPAEPVDPNVMDESPPSSSMTELPGTIVASNDFFTSTPPHAGPGHKRKVSEIQHNLELSYSPGMKKSLESFDRLVPVQPPPEIQALIDAYIRNTPVLAITSRQTMLAYCGASIGHLYSEFQYMYMGFFKVLFVKEERVFRPSNDSAAGILVRSDYSFGRVQWRFGLEWISAGEENLFIPAHLKLDRPWWRDTTDWKKPPEEMENVTVQTHDSTVESAPAFKGSLSIDILVDLDAEHQSRFRNRRQADPSYSSRDKPLGPRCPSIVWLALLAHTNGSGDVGSTRGWYCNSCGKLNRQRFFKRRKCDSSFCEDAPLSDCSVQQLDNMRSIGQQIPLVLPLDVMPKYMDPVVSEWDDGMRTVSYHVWSENIVKRILEQIHSTTKSLSSGPAPSMDFQSVSVKEEALENLILLEEVSSTVPAQQEGLLQPVQTSEIPRSAQDIGDIEKKKGVVARHIFTCNYPRLQMEQTQLLSSIQESVVLQRMAMNTTPYFSYVAGVVPKNTFASDFVNSDVLPVLWKDVPACIEQAQDFMQHLGKTYGEQPFLINQLVVLGWTVTGKKKGDHCFRAKDRNVIIMALGHELGIRIVPKSGFPVNTLRTEKIDDVKTEIIGGAKPEIIDKPLAQSTDWQNATKMNAMDVGTHTDESGDNDPAPVPSDKGQAFAEIPIALVDSRPPGDDKLATQSAYKGEPLPAAALDQISTHSAMNSRLLLSEVDLNGLIRMASEPPDVSHPAVTHDDEIPNDDEEDTELGKISWLGEVEDDHDAYGVDESSSSQRVVTRKKAAIKEDMYFLLVHGDALVLSGDDFDFSIERKGMGLLLVGCNV